MSAPTASVATSGDMPEVAALRTRVFVVEQGVPPEIEQDAADATAVHVLSRDDSGRVVATGRLLVHGRTAGIGRMAADATVRGRGHGAAVLAELHRQAILRGATEVELHAQVTARGSTSVRGTPRSARSTRRPVSRMSRCGGYCRSGALVTARPAGRLGRM